MDFTREPIVETVITPKDGYKLVLRNSKIGGQEEFFVDAVEVISFGKSTFFRSLEKPKNFLLPVNDYEILEVREARMPLKMPAPEQQKMTREPPVKPAPREKVEEPMQAKEDKPRERRRLRKKREAEEGEIKPSLIPPPATLIRETLTRHKETLLPVEDEVREEESLEEPSILTPDEETPF